MKTCSLSHFLPMNLKTHVHMQKRRVCILTLLFLSISKPQYRNSSSYFNLLSLFSSDMSLKPCLVRNDQLQPQREWSVFSSRRLLFILLNFNSLLTKINELRNIPRLSNTAVICISQSRLEDSVLLSEIPIDNYSILYCDWNGHGGGVVCYIKNDINSFFHLKLKTFSSNYYYQIRNL